MLKPSEIMKEIAKDPGYADRLLYPGRQLADFDANGLKVDVMSSGFPSLDKAMLLKRNRGELIIIAARPSKGKSALACQIASHVAQQGRVHMFSLEMDLDSIAARHVAAKMNRPLDWVQNGGATLEDVTRIKAEFGSLNYLIDDEAGLNIYQIVERAKAWHKRSPTSMILIDYVQIVDYDQKGVRALELAKVSHECAKLAKGLKIPVVMLSQLNRMSEVREDGKPALADLKESGSLEQDADVVLLIHPNKENRERVTFIMAKNRNGPTGEINMGFAPSQCRFIDFAGGELD